MRESLLSVPCRQIILGSLLGDGSLKIHPEYRNARFAFRHSEKQSEYFHWKVSQLNEISSDKSVWLQSPGNGDFSRNDKWRYQSRALPELTAIYNETSDNHRLRIRRRWLNKLSPLALAIWWMEDGSLIGREARRGVLCTDGFQEAEVHLLSDYLKVVWDIETHVSPAGRPDQFRIWLRSTGELKKFLRIVIPHIPVASMLAKVILLYRDSDLQQRWISEVQQLSLFDYETIHDALEAKKQKWSAFASDKDIVQPTQ